MGGSGWVGGQGHLRTQGLRGWDVDAEVSMNGDRKGMERKARNQGMRSPKDVSTTGTGVDGAVGM